MIEHLFAWFPYILLLCLFLYKIGTRNHDYFKRKGIPYVKPLPFVGSIMGFLRKPGHEEELRRYREFGPIYGFFEGNKANLSVADPDLVKEILVGMFSIFSGRRELCSGDIVVDNMLAVIRGDAWKRIRDIVSPTFTVGRIKKTMNIFKSCSETMIQNFRVFADEEKSLDVKRVFGAFTMDVIARSAFSTTIDSHNDPDNAFVKYAKRVLNMKMEVKFICFHTLPTKLMRLFNISITDVEATHALKNSALEIMQTRKRNGLFLDSHFMTVFDPWYQIKLEPGQQTRPISAENWSPIHDPLEASLQTRKLNIQVCKDFLQLLMDAAEEYEESLAHATERGENNEGNNNMSSRNVYKRMSMDELASQSVAFFLAGYDTTASTLSFAAYLLALNQNIQDKLRAEVDTILENNNGELTYEDIQSMKYMNNVLSETLRLYPPIYRLERQANADCQLGDTGITIRKGTLVTVPVYAMNRDPKYWSDPETFNPDRFEVAGRNHPHFLPFGNGNKKCLGKLFAEIEVKVCLSYLLANFKIHTCPETKVPIDFDKGLNGLLQPLDITLRMEVRESPPLIT